MIFQQEHIEQMYGDLKWMTRRWSDKVPVHKLYKRYNIGQLYAVQPGRGKKGVSHMKIGIIRKWIESTNRQETCMFLAGLRRDYFTKSAVIVENIPISAADANAEGDYSPESFEVIFKNLNPKWDGIARVGLEFEVIRYR